jgi:hypothetical protein
MAVFGEIPKEAERRRKLAEQKYSQEKAKVSSSTGVTFAYLDSNSATLR